jgi:hypothetical protein
VYPERQLYARWESDANVRAMVSEANPFYINTGKSPSENIEDVSSILEPVSKSALYGKIGLTLAEVSPMLHYQKRKSTIGFKTFPSLFPDMLELLDILVK